MGNSANSRVSAYASATGIAIPELIWSAEASIAAALQFIVGANQLSFSGTAGIGMDVFADALVLSTNFNLVGLDHSGSYTAAMWPKADTSKSASALVLWKPSGTTGTTLRLYQVPAATTGPVTISAYQVAASADNGVEFNRGLVMTTDSVVPTTGNTYKKAVHVDGSPLKIVPRVSTGRGIGSPGLILSSGGQENNHIVFDFGDALAYIVDRLPAILSNAVTASPVPTLGTADVNNFFRQGGNLITGWAADTAGIEIEIDLLSSGYSLNSPFTGTRFRPAIRFWGDGTVATTAEINKITGVTVVVSGKNGITPVGETTVVDVTPGQLDLGSNAGDQWFWLLPAFDIADSGFTEIDFIRYTISFSSVLANPLYIRRVHLFHDNAPTTANISPTWADIAGSADLRYGPLSIYTRLPDVSTAGWSPAVRITKRPGDASQDGIIWWDRASRSPSNYGFGIGATLEDSFKILRFSNDTVSAIATVMAEFRSVGAEIKSIFRDGVFAYGNTYSLVGGLRVIATVVTTAVGGTTHAVPTGATAVLILASGGGGGGGGGDGGLGGGGGGSGATGWLFYRFAAGDYVHVVVGAGGLGAGIQNGNGDPGGGTIVWIKNSSNVVLAEFTLGGGGGGQGALGGGAGGLNGELLTGASLMVFGGNSGGDGVSGQGGNGGYGVLGGKPGVGANGTDTATAPAAGAHGAGGGGGCQSPYGGAYGEQGIAVVMFL
jgi:hypothetical protein